MSIFRRRGKSTESDVEALGERADSAVEDEDEGVEGGDISAPGRGGPSAPDTGSSAGPAAQVEVNRSAGPFDRSEVADAGGRLDLGSLWVGGMPGMELRLELDEATQQVVAANAVVGESAVHLQAFAAPRSAGVWDEIRAEIAASITRQGGTADEANGPLGTELRASMPAPGPGGRVLFSPVRFIGVDGPRWFLRAVISGRAAQDAAVAGPLLDVVRSTVVVRGDEAMAPRDLLPLQLPQVDGVHSGVAEPVDGDGDEEAVAMSADELRPFERGPEITEIR